MFIWNMYENIIYIYKYTLSRWWLPHHNSICIIWCNCVRDRTDYNRDGPWLQKEETPFVLLGCLCFVILVSAYIHLSWPSYKYVFQIIYLLYYTKIRTEGKIRHSLFTQRVNIYFLSNKTILATTLQFADRT